MPRIIPECDESRCLRHRYRDALLSLGKSPDTHVYDLRRSFLPALGKKDDLLFLERVKRFYEGLSFSEQRLFVKECLERGRHYRFWYIGQIDEGSYLQDYANLQSKLKAVAL